MTGPATEAELAASVDANSQPTAHRRLKRLSDVRLITREGGKSRAPGRLWTVVHPDETGALLDALLALADAIESRDKTRREAVKRKLKLARAERLGIRPARPG